MRISDWSSDVCSSDLHGLDCARTSRSRHLGNALTDAICIGLGHLRQADGGMPVQVFFDLARVDILAAAYDHVFQAAQHIAVTTLVHYYQVARMHPAFEIGRASCRERVCQYV